MDANTLRCITTGISAREIDSVLEAYLPQYVDEINAVLQKMRAVSRGFSPDLEPAPVFFVQPGKA
jgi:hypothetical protein